MKIKILYIFFSAAFLIPNSFCFAQNKKIESLLILLKKDKADSNKVITLNKLSSEYKSIGNYDTALSYAETALQLAQQLNEKKEMAEAYNNIRSVHYNKGNYRQAIEYAFKTLKIDEELADKKGIASTLSNIGLVYYEQADYSKALDYNFKALKMAQDFENKTLQANLIGNIGIVYSEQADYSKALDYYFKALKMAEEHGNKNNIAIWLSNIGIIYLDQGNYQKALDYDFKALKIVEESGDIKGMAAKLGNIGIVYKFQRDYPKALDFYLKALKIAKELGDKKEISIILGNIGLLYISLKKYEDAFNHIYPALALSDSIGAMDIVKNGFNNLSQLYEKADVSLPDSIGGKRLTMEQMRLRSLYYYKRSIAIRDTLFSQENKKQLIRKELNFEFEKREAATKAENEKQQLAYAEKNRKQKIIIWSVVCCLLLVIVFAGFVFRSLRTTRRQKQIIEVKSRETEEQKKIIAEKNKDMLDSLRYASAIQQTVITSESYFAENLQEFFILFLPKDIVAGDFYWAYNRGDEFFIAVGDCTGHGVPGAFMSLMGINFLNEIVMEQKIYSPAETLNRLRQHIINAFASAKTERRDGMDICFYKLNIKEKSLTYAAANNPLWICRNTEIIKYKSDKMPVGMHHGITESFLEQTIMLQKGDIIYTFTDGFADQFGGPKGKKFMYKQFNEKLLAISHLPLPEQKNILLKTFEKWKGSLEQIDDVCVIGVKI